MADITEIPTAELLLDLQESLDDITTCNNALKVGVLTYGNGESTRYRYDVNLRIVEKIRAELKRREAESNGN